VGIRARDFDDYRAPTGVVSNSGWRENGLSGWDHDRHAKLVGGWQIDRGRDIGRPAATRPRCSRRVPTNSHRLTASFEDRSVGWFRNVAVSGLFGSGSEGPTRIGWHAKQPESR
jgi:hypothetical protein